MAGTLRTANSEARATALEALDTLGDKQLVKSRAGRDAQYLTPAARAPRTVRLVTTGLPGSHLIICRRRSVAVLVGY